jgi:hypothetical protein
MCAYYQRVAERYLSSEGELRSLKRQDDTDNCYGNAVQPTPSRGAVAYFQPITARALPTFSAETSRRDRRSSWCPSDRHWAAQRPARRSSYLCDDAGLSRSVGIGESARSPDLAKAKHEACGSALKTDSVSIQFCNVRPESCAPSTSWRHRGDSICRKRFKTI